MKGAFLLLLLAAFAPPAVADSMLGAVDTEIFEPVTIASDAVIVVTANELNSSPNIEFYAKRFAETLRTKYPNTSYGRLSAGREPDIIVSVQASSVLKNHDGQETVYSEEPKSWRCSEYLKGVECKTHETTRRAVGSRSVTYSFVGYKFSTSWMFADSEGYNVKFFARGTLVANVESGMCTNLEAFGLLSKAIVDFSRSDEPVERNFSFTTPRRAGCKGGD